MKFRCTIVFALTLSLFSNGYGQATVNISGIIVDSVSLVALPNAHVKAKRSGIGVTANSSGQFNIKVLMYDTLIFTSIGYRSVEYAVLFTEEDILIRLRETVI